MMGMRPCMGDGGWLTTTVGVGWGWGRDQRCGGDSTHLLFFFVESQGRYLNPKTPSFSGPVVPAGGNVRMWVRVDGACPPAWCGRSRKQGLGVGQHRWTARKRWAWKKDDTKGGACKE
jgi:hypothetical protein